MSARLPDTEFVSPSLAPVFNPERVAALLPANAAIKGIFIDDVLGQVPDRGETLRRAGVESGRVGAFSDVPYLTYLRIVGDVAARKRPGEPLGATVREMARGYYARLRETIPGKVVFGVMGNNALRVLGQGHRGWRLSLNFGEFSSEVVGERNVRFRFADYPADMVDASDTGVVLGALDTLGEKGRVRIARIDEMNSEIDVKW